MHKGSLSLAGLALLVLTCLVPPTAHADELNIYSHRQRELINPFLDAFQAETGVTMNVVFAVKGLAQRLEAEGARSPADVILTVDIARLSDYAERGLLAPVDSAVLSENVPVHLRDPENRWFALSKRARVVAYSKERVAEGEIGRLEDLVDVKWRGRLCTRAGSHVYNRALLSSLIAANGEAAAEAWAQGLVGNLARNPQGNDRAQIKAIHEGVCDAAIVNNYYIQLMKNSEATEQREWVASVGVAFTNQNDRGNHINISGAGVAVHSKHKATAVAFIEFLTRPDMQALYAKLNHEYPVKLGVVMSGALEPFVEDHVQIGTIATLAPRAQMIIDRVGW